MPAPILVSPQPRTAASWFFLIFALILFIPGILIVSDELETGLVLITIAGLFTLFGVILRWHALRGKRSILIHPDGFEWVEKNRYIPDRSVIGLSGEWNHYYSKGEVQGLQLKASIYLAAGDEEEIFPLLYRVPTGSPDFVNPWLIRLYEMLHLRLTERFAQGKEWKGNGWTVTAKGIRVHQREGDRFVPAGEIAAAHFFNGHLGIWKCGEDDPFLRIPQTERDCMLLSRVIWEELIGDVDHWRADRGDLGPRCFERNLTLPTWKWLGLILLSVLGIVAGPFVAYFGFLGIQPKVGIIGIGMVIGGVVGLRIAWNRRLLELHVHLRGLRIVKPRRDDALRFDEIASMTCTHALGAAQGEARPSGEWRLKVEPLEGIDCEPLHMWAHFPADDSDLIALRESIANAIANRMWNQLLQDGEVAWNDKIWIRPGELMVQDGRRSENDGWREVPYLTFQRESWDAKKFYFHNLDRDVALEMGGPNFYPGLVLVRYLWSLAMKTTGPLPTEAPFAASLPRLASTANLWSRS